MTAPTLAPVTTATHEGRGWEPGAPGWDPQMLRRWQQLNQTPVSTSTKARP
jgi:hypothetical protein